MMKTVGEKIKELRRSKGMSQSEIAEKLGVTSQAISKWENNSSLPEMTLLPDIASLFGVQIDDLFEYSKEKRYESIGKKIEYGKNLTNVEFDQEEGFLLREIETNSENYEAISLLGDLYRYQACALNRKCVSYAKRALKLKPNSKSDINNICNGSGGKIFDWDVGSHHQLVEELKTILRADPANVRLYFYILDNLIDDCCFDEAREVLKKSRESHPDPLNEYYAIFIDERENGFSAVEERYQKLVEQYDSDWRVLFSVANSYTYHARYEKAIMVWDKVIAHMEKPGYVDPYESIALSYLRLGKKEDAIRYYQMELDVLRNEWNIRFGSQVDEIKQKIEKLR